MDWIRLVESKIRHLVLNLEKIQHISLAHISPESYPQTSET
jgi:poly(A) polymerase Pap1